MPDAELEAAPEQQGFTPPAPIVQAVQATEPDVQVPSWGMHDNPDPETARGRVKDFLRVHAMAGRSPEEMTANFERHFPGMDAKVAEQYYPEWQKRARLEVDLDLARDKAQQGVQEGTGPSEGNFWLRKAVSFPRELITSGIYAHAQSKYKAGNADESDLRNIALYEAEQQSDAAQPAWKRLGGVVASTPSQAAGFMAGGEAAAMLLPAKLATGTGLAAVAARTATGALTTPNVALQNVIHQNIEAGRDWADIRGVPAGAALGIAQMTVYHATGELGKKLFPELSQSTLGNIASQAAIGPYAQAAVDLTTYGLGLQTHYGSLQSLIEKKGDFAERVLGDALTFASMAALHGASPDGKKFLEQTALELNAEAKKGVSAPKAAESLRKRALDVLGVDADATEEDIRQSFRSQAIRTHPDRGGDPARFARVNWAYDLLAKGERWAGQQPTEPTGGMQTPADYQAKMLPGEWDVGTPTPEGFTGTLFTGGTITEHDPRGLGAEGVPIGPQGQAVVPRGPQTWQEAQAQRRGQRYVQGPDNDAALLRGILGGPEPPEGGQGAPLPPPGPKTGPPSPPALQGNQSPVQPARTAPTAPPEPKTPDQRKNNAFRANVEGMTDYEKTLAIRDLREGRHRSERTGLRNLVAYNETERQPSQGWGDVDGLKAINDTFGHPAGDALIKAVGDAFHAEGLKDAYHFSGDEFGHEGPDHATVDEALKRVQDRLAKAEMIFVDPKTGRQYVKKGIGFSYGVAETLDKAEEGAGHVKQQREQSGEREPRAAYEARLKADPGALPRGVSEIPAAGGQVRGDQTGPGTTQPPPVGAAGRTAAAPAPTKIEPRALVEKLTNGEPVPGVSARQAGDLHQHVVQGKTLEEIGRQRGVTKEAVRQSVDKALDKLQDVVADVPPPAAEEEDKPTVLKPGLGELPSRWVENPTVEKVSDALIEYVAEAARAERKLPDEELARINNLRTALDDARPGSAAERKSIAQATAFLKEVEQRGAEPEPDLGVPDPLRQHIRNLKRQGLIYDAGKFIEDIAEAGYQDHADELRKAFAIPKKNKAPEGVGRGLTAQSAAQGRRSDSIPFVERAYQEQRASAKLGEAGDFFERIAKQNGVTPSVAQKIVAFAKEEGGYFDPAEFRQGLLERVAQLAKGFRYFNDHFQELAGGMVPRMTRISNLAGEAVSRWIAAPGYARLKAPEMIDKTLGKDMTPEDDKLYGSVAVEWRLRFAKQAYFQKAQEESNAGVDARQAGDLKAAKEHFDNADEAGRIARGVTSGIGKDWSELKSFDQYAQLVKSGRFQGILKNWQAKGGMTELMNDNFRKSQGLEDTDPIQSFTQHPGVPMNMIGLKEGQEARQGVGGGNKPNFGALKLGKNPFANQFKGDAEAYDTSLSNIIRNSIERGATNAAKAEAIRTMTEEGVAKFARPGQQVEGFKEFKFTNPPKGTQHAENGETSLYVAQEAAHEWEKALATGTPYEIPGATKLMSWLTKTSLFSTVEAAYHSTNNLTQLAKAELGGIPGNSLYRLFTNSIKRMSGNEAFMAQLTDLARIGAQKEGGAEGSALNPLNWTQKFLHGVNDVMRVTLDDTYSRLVKQGRKMDTETDRRNFINALGQYNRKAQQDIVGLARDLGIGPFSTAGTNFAAQAFRSLFGGTGGRATSAGQEAGIRAEYLARIGAVLGATALANYFSWGRLDGDDNTPFGALKLGDDGKGRSSYVSLSSIFTPVIRGMRETGLLALTEGQRRGESVAKSADKGKDAAVQAIFHPFFGPGAQFTYTAVTGKNTFGEKIAEEAGPGESQTWRNLTAAIENANPTFGTLSGADKPGRDVPMREKVGALMGPFGEHFRGPAQAQPVSDFKEAYHFVDAQYQHDVKKAREQGLAFKSPVILQDFREAAGQINKLEMQVHRPDVTPDRLQAIREQQVRIAQRVMEKKRRMDEAKASAATGPR